MRDLMETDEFRYYVEDKEGVLSFEERLRPICGALCEEKDAHAATRV